MLLQRRGLEFATVYCSLPIMSQYMPGNMILILLPTLNMHDVPVDYYIIVIYLYNMRIMRVTLAHTILLHHIHIHGHIVYYIL